LEAAISLSAGNNVCQVSLMDGVSPQDAAQVGEKLRAKATELNGSVFLLCGQAQIKESFDAWGDHIPGAPLMINLKQKLDPKGVFNPGRFLGGL
jgi:FAD/FMN-containing dehydrogenase